MVDDIDDLTTLLEQAMITVPYKSPLWNRALAAFNATVHDGPIDAMDNAFAIVERGALERAANARPVGGSHVGGSEWARGYAQGVRDKYDAVLALIDAAADARPRPPTALAVLDRELQLIASQCGAPDAAEGCRLILKTVERARAALALAERGA